ncbi:MAG: hypothetical protein ACTSXQ_02945 [Alphaproteobacteria bacterium]
MKKIEEKARILAAADGVKHYERFTSYQGGKYKNKYLTQATKLEKMGVSFSAIGESSVSPSNSEQDIYTEMYSNLYGQDNPVLVYMSLMENMFNQLTSSVVSAS